LEDAWRQVIQLDAGEEAPQLHFLGISSSKNPMDYLGNPSMGRPGGGSRAQPGGKKGIAEA